MDQKERQQEKTKYLLNMDIDESYEFAKGFGIKHLLHFILIFPLVGLIVWWVLAPIQSEIVRVIIRVFGEGIAVVLVFLIVRLKRFQHCSMTYISILGERLRFKLRQKNNQTCSYYVKKGNDPF